MGPVNAPPEPARSPAEAAPVIDPNPFTRRVVVIVGASSGIGRATAWAFAAQGASLVLAARRGDVLDQVVRECVVLGGRAVAVQTDVSDPEQVEVLAEAAKRAFGGFDVWINAAAVMSFGRVEETPSEVLARIVHTNLIGHLYGAQAALQHFRTRGRGVLINTGSVLGVVGQPFSAAYVSTKFAVRGLSEALRQEVQGEPDIHVCTVSPAAIDTPIYQRAANYMGRELLPIRLLYPPSVVARACVRLADRPRRELLAGAGFGHLAALGKVLAPPLAEAFTGFAVRLMEIGDRAAPATAGNVFDPVRDGRKVSGGWRRRYRQPWSVTAGCTLGLTALGLALLACRSRPAGASHP